MINKMMAVLGLALTLVGCDHPDMLSSSQINQVGAGCYRLLEQAPG